MVDDAVAGRARRGRAPPRAESALRAGRRVQVFSKPADVQTCGLRKTGADAGAWQCACPRPPAQGRTMAILRTFVIGE
jgi:hypothetical protein